MNVTDLALEAVLAKHPATYALDIVLFHGDQVKAPSGGQEALSRG